MKYKIEFGNGDSVAKNHGVKFILFFRELGINDIEDLGEGAFENLTELHDLHLHKNRVTKLTAATFRGLVNLRNL